MLQLIQTSKNEPLSRRQQVIRSVRVPSDLILTAAVLLAAARRLPTADIQNAVDTLIDELNFRCGDSDLEVEPDEESDPDEPDADNEASSDDEPEPDDEESQVVWNEKPPRAKRRRLLGLQGASSTLRVPDSHRDGQPKSGVADPRQFLLRATHKPLARKSGIKKLPRSLSQTN